MTMDEKSSLPIRLQPSNLRPVAYRIISKKHGLNLKTDALNLLTEIVSYRFGFDWKGPKSQQLLEEIASAWKREDRGLFIDSVGLKQIIKELSDKPESNSEGIAKARRSDTLVDDEQRTGAHNNSSYDQENVLDWKHYFKVVNADQSPHLKFDKSRKQFSLVPHSSKLEGNAQAAVEYFTNRYYLIMDRLSRNESFQKSSFASITSFNQLLSKSRTGNEITQIKNMLGRDGSKFILFGLLAKDSNGNFTLEDSTDYIELNLTQTFKAEGSYYCPGMFVITEGIYSASGGVDQSSNYMGGCFYVSNIAHPPAERRDASLDAYGNLDFLGVHKDTTDFKSSANQIVKLDRVMKKKLSSTEKSLANHKMIVLGSDCFLDDFKVLDGLKKLFAKLEDSINGEEPPLAIVLMGSFCSTPFTPTNASKNSISNSETYKSNFDELSNILSKYPELIKTTKFILVPGKNDPWQSGYSLGGSNLNVLPQTSIPKLFISRLERLLPRGNLILGWNPCRVNYLSQEIVILKDELISKFKRNDIIFSTDLEKEKEKQEKEKDALTLQNIVSSETHLSPGIKQARKVVKTLLDQGNLQPFLKNLKVVNAKYDYALRVEPLPTVIILNDSHFKNFEVTYNGCKVINLGTLVALNRKLNYAEYYPSNKKFFFKEIFF